MTCKVRKVLRHTVTTSIEGDCESRAVAGYCAQCLKFRRNVRDASGGVMVIFFFPQAQTRGEAPSRVSPALPPPYPPPLAGEGRVGVGVTPALAGGEPSPRA